MLFKQKFGIIKFIERYNINNLEWDSNVILVFFQAINKFFKDIKMNTWLFRELFIIMSSNFVQILLII